MSKQETPQEHIHYHRDGTIWAKGEVIGDTASGYWEWYRKDGSLMRSGYFREGIQVGLWTTYNREGQVVKVTDMKDGRKGTKKTTIDPSGS